MRDLRFTLAFLLALTGVGTAAAGDMAGMKMAPTASASAVRTGKGTGFIKAIDARAGTVTLQHGPIAGLGWPAMTMTFKAAPEGRREDRLRRPPARRRRRDHRRSALTTARRFAQRPVTQILRLICDDAGHNLARRRRRW